MAKGNFQTHRNIFDNSLWFNVIEFRTFFYLYGNAVFSKEGVTYGNVHIKRGQVLKSYRAIQDALKYIDNNSIKKYSLSTIKRIINNLTNQGRISTETTELGTLFTIVNYDLYQGFGSILGSTERTATEQRENSERTATEQRENNNKNDKNVKNVKNDKNKTSLEIKNFRLRYSDSELKIIDEYFDILRWTRKSGVIADSIIIGQYKYWEKHSIPKVIYGLKTYIGNPKHHDKRENYTNAIIRNATAEQVADKKETKPKRVIVDQNPFLNRR